MEGPEKVQSPQKMVLSRKGKWSLSSEWSKLAKLFAPRRRKAAGEGLPQGQRPWTQSEQQLGRDEAQSVSARLDEMTWQALYLLHWGLISEKRSERRLARQIMRQWLRIDDSGEVVFWTRPPKKRRRHQPPRHKGTKKHEAARRRSSYRKRSRCSSRHLVSSCLRGKRRAAQRRRVENFLADLGAPLALRPIPARMRPDRGGGPGRLAQRAARLPAPASARPTGCRAFGPAAAKARGPMPTPSTKAPTTASSPDSGNGRAISPQSRRARRGQPRRVLS